MRRCPTSRQLEERERVAAASARIRSRTGSSIRPGIAETRTVRACWLIEGSEGQLRKAREVSDVAGFAQGEKHHDRLGRQPARDEAEDLGRRSVEPLPVIDQADQWLGFGDVGEECEHGKPDEEPIRRGPTATRTPWRVRRAGDRAAVRADRGTARRADGARRRAAPSPTPRRTSAQRDIRPRARGRSRAGLSCQHRPRPAQRRPRWCRCARLRSADPAGRIPRAFR